MIPINDAGLYETALVALRDAVGGGYLGRVAQIFLACKHYGKRIPQIGDPVGISSSEIEQLLDELYIKPGRHDPKKILIMFENTYKVPTGETAGGLTGPSNIWRNNLNFQKGYMCYAAPAELSNPSFRNQSRTLCPHLQTTAPGTLAGATCSIKSDATYRGEDHPKVFRKDPLSGEYFVYDPSDADFYRTIVLPSNGNKLPIIAVIIALYYGGKLAASRTQVSIEDFLTDFDFSSVEARTYFEDDPDSQAHTLLRAKDSALNWTRLIASPAESEEVGTEPLPGEPSVPAPLVAGKKKKKQTILPAMVQTSAPPAGSFWWNAEQAVRTLLEADGWGVLDVSRLGVGFDLKATKAETLRNVEVKSSVGPCAPALTEREYNEAKQSRAKYVLAVVEYFDPTKPVSIQWVRDPARLQVTERNVKDYYLPRSVWKVHATGNFP